MLQNSENTNKPRFVAQSIISKYNLEKQISIYFDEILKYNQKVNIVSRETILEDLMAIAADSLIPFEFIPPPEGNIFDIGPGAGFPSVVIMIAFPNLQGWLIERTGKKVAFLKQIVRQLKLSANIEKSNFIEIGTEAASRSFDFGFMKLVRPDSKLLQTAFDILKPAGKFIYYSDIKNSSANIPGNIKFQRYKYFLDKSNRLRTITVFSKTS